MLTQKFNKEFLDEVTERQIVASAEQRAATASAQIAADRIYYTQHVVVKLKKESKTFKAGADYNETTGAIPLPATFLREVSESLNESAGYRYDLLSKFNITKGKGLRDAFERRAWDELKQNPGTSYSGLVATDRGVELRYATADVANVASCVSCHNKHPKSPKKDFKLGDLMGIMVVSVPTTENPALAQKLLQAKGDLQNDAVEKTRKLFETTLAALRQGGTTYKDLAMTQPVTIPGNTDPEIEAKYATVSQLWNEMQDTVQAVRSEKPNFSSAEFVGRLNTVRERGLACLKEMNAAVTMAQANSEARATMMQNIQCGAIGLAMVTFVCVLLYIRRSVTGPINRIVAGLNEGADQVNDAAGQVSSSSQQLAEGASEQASSLEETSSALEQMAAMTRTNAENARQANGLTDKAREAAQIGDQIGRAACRERG